MYYSDLVAAAEKDITSSNFCFLVDAAVMMMYEKVKSNSHTKTTAKTLSAKEEEEERDKKIFILFPRKSRTSVKKFFTRRNPQHYHQNLNGASTSSSRNPLQCPSLLLDLNTIPADDSYMTYPQNPDSSSSLLLLDLYSIPADSENTDMTNPGNPNFQSSSCLVERKTSRKRCAVEDKKRCGKFKKAKFDDAFSWIGRETPESLTQLMNDANETVIRWGERTDLRLIFQKTLFKTDVNPSESRLSMPFNELIRNDFLTPVELSVIKQDINNAYKTGVGAILVDERNVKFGVMLKRWEMKKDSGKGSWNYALTCGWNDIVKGNRLKEGDDISIWSFRWGGLLCFALVTPPPSMAQSSSSIPLCL